MSEQDSVSPPVSPPLSSATPPPPRSAASRASADTAPLLFDESGVTVSTSRIVVYGTPFPLKGATGVRLFQDRPHIRFAVPIEIAGLMLGAYGIYASYSPALALAVMLIVVGYLTYRFQTMRHRVFLIRPPGETHAVAETEVAVHSDYAFTQRIKQALEQALQSTEPTVRP